MLISYMEEQNNLAENKNCIRFSCLKKTGSLSWLRYNGKVSGKRLVDGQVSNFVKIYDQVQSHELHSAHLRRTQKK